MPHVFRGAVDVKPQALHQREITQNTESAKAEVVGENPTLSTRSVKQANNGSDVVNKNPKCVLKAVRLTAHEPLVESGYNTDVTLSTHPLWSRKM